MELFWIIALIILSIILMGYVVLLIFKPNEFKDFNSLNAILAMNSVIVLLILVISFVLEREDSMIDIALSYAILGFVTSIILAKYLGGRRK